ncbi:MAG: cytidylate kinase-like family protein [Candidatus Eremiobacteraeota bacterium]|nr:cytidylate kinase-like family protein [Candidatus Eremiobacteraeota bacterium]
MIVTISNEYGSGALGIGRSVAERLDYLFVDEQLPVVVAKRLRTSPQAVDAAQDPRRGFGARLLAGLEKATPELQSAGGERESFDEQCLREVESAVREFARAGNVVLFGRAANAILGRRPEVLRLFVYAPREWRAQRLMEELGVSEKVANDEITRIDQARAAYTRDHYRFRWGDPHYYDLSLDAASLGAQAAGDIIERAVKALGRW